MQSNPVASKKEIISWIRDTFPGADSIKVNRLDDGTYELDTVFAPGKVLGFGRDAKFVDTWEGTEFEMSLSDHFKTWLLAEESTSNKVRYIDLNTFEITVIPDPLPMDDASIRDRLVERVKSRLNIAQVRYGVYNQPGEHAGKTVGDMRRQYQSLWGIPKDAEAWMGVTKLPETYVIRPGDNVEFHRRAPSWSY